MRKLEYTFKTDTLFKMLFVQYPELLTKLVADLLGTLETTRHTRQIKWDSISLNFPNCQPM